MKKIINPHTGKEDYFLNHKEAADHIYMTVGMLKYRYTVSCTMHESMVPKRSTLHNINGFWLSDLDHYKNNNIGLTRKNKQKVAEKNGTAEVLEFSQKKRT
jgi:hypothetical protein|tara:strand:+ start:606 stop:908 length:303 start_codon:yes stop_codon:yes gene_type:complete